MDKLFKYVYKPNKNSVIIIGLYVFFSNFFTYSIPYIVKIIIENNSNINFIQILLLFLFFFIVIRYISTVGIDILYVKFTEKFSFDIRTKIIEKIIYSCPDIF